MKGDILTLHCEDEEDAVIFQREGQWKGGNEAICSYFIKKKETKWCKLTQQDLLQKSESSLQSTKLDLKKFVKLLLPLWCMNIKNIKHLRERRQVV